MPEEAQSFDFRRGKLLEALDRTVNIAHDKYNNNYGDALNINSLIRFGNGYRVERINQDETIRHPVRLSPNLYPTFAISQDNTRLIEYLDPKTGRLKSAKPSTILKLINRTSEAAMPDDSLQIIATIIGEELPTQYGYAFDLVQGESIRELYHVTPYTCMTNSKAINFYVNNAPDIKAVRIKKDGVTIGRAILWPLIDGRKYLDRIYPSSGPHVNLLNNHATKEGWISRESTQAEITTKVQKRLEAEDPITIPFKTPSKRDRSAHSMGAFPYQDTFRWMKHSPDLTQAMLRFAPRAGWVAIGDEDRYRDLFYCPLLRGWVNQNAVVTARVLDNDFTFRPETSFSRDVLRRTHTLIRWPRQEGARIQNTRAYISNEFLDDIVIDDLTGARFLTRHGVQTPEGSWVFIEDALHMHDDTYLRSSEQLRNVAMLPNGRFILREEAEYDPETRAWSPKGTA